MKWKATSLVLAGLFFATTCTSVAMPGYAAQAEDGQTQGIYARGGLAARTVQDTQGTAEADGGQDAQQIPEAQLAQRTEAMVQATAEGTQAAAATATQAALEARAAQEAASTPDGPAVYVDGEWAQQMAYAILDGVPYVTAASFITAFQPDAAVEAWDGGVSIQAVQAEVVVEGEVEPVATVVEEVLSLTAQKGNTYLEANGRYLVVKQGVRLLDGQAAVPVSVMAQVYNLEYWYDSATGHSYLTHQPGASTFLTSGEAFYNQTDLYWLSRIIQAESGNQSLTGMIAVGNVVMNRVADSRFPNTVKGVIFQTNQFTPAMTGSVYNTPGTKAVLAAKLVLEGAVALNGVLFFNTVGLDCYASRNRTYVATIGGHSFYA